VKGRPETRTTEQSQRNSLRTKCKSDVGQRSGCQAEVNAMAERGFAAFFFQNSCGRICAGVEEAAPLFLPSAA
jgi:hypothetical protein